MIIRDTWGKDHFLRQISKHLDPDNHGSYNESTNPAIPLVVFGLTPWRGEWVSPAKKQIRLINSVLKVDDVKKVEEGLGVLMRCEVI